MSILRPDRMHFLRLVLLKDDLPAVFSLLLKRDVIHIEKASNFFGHESSYTPVQTHSAQADMLALKQNLKETAAALKINPKHRTGLAPDRIPSINPLEYTSIIQPELADLMQQVKPLWHAINTGRARAKQLEVFSRIMVMLEERNLDPQMIRKGTFSEFEVGLIPSDALDTLKSGLSNIPHCLEHSPYSREARRLSSAWGFSRNTAPLSGKYSKQSSSSRFLFRLVLSPAGNRWKENCTRFSSSWRRQRPTWLI